MKVLIINSVCGIGSTGRICADIADKLVNDGHEVKIAYGRDFVPEECRKYAVKIGNGLGQKLHGLKTRLFDKHGLGSKRATKKFLRWAEEYNPDLLWLHNIHGYYLNYELLFKWIKSRPNMQVKWTLHDCWAFTGHCAHFIAVKCDKWQSHCSFCSQKYRYPISRLKDNSKNNFDRKRIAFTGVKNMTVITPSNWLRDLVKKSFLKDYPVEVHYNTIDTDVFKPTPSDFREKYNLQDKKIILGVAGAWDERKGLGDFIKLAELLDERFAIVLVGLSKRQIKSISKKIIAINRTNSKKELAEIYSSADVFVNPSKEETFGLTTVEATACGTNAIVYKGTACEEVVKAQGKGVAVEQNIDELKMQIENLVLNSRGGGKPRSF